jgi:hypothetical protein
VDNPLLWTNLWRNLWVSAEVQGLEGRPRRRIPSRPAVHHQARRRDGARPGALPACTAFIPHEWERDEATRTVTCNVCLVVVRTLAQLENVESCKGPTPEHMRALRDVKLRGNGVLSAE